MIKTTLFAAIISTLSASTALAGYTIYKDDAFPSVMFVEIEGGPAEQPTVISAPASVSADPALPVITNDNDEGERRNVESAPVYDEGTPEAETAQSEAPQPTFEERVERNVQLGDSTNEAVQRVFNEDQLDEMELR
ncbi:MAG: hypothetical protein AAFR39_05815 [Pseudomonadota bacterium]